MTVRAVTESLAAAEQWLLDRDAVEATLARSVAGLPEREAGEASRWVDRILRSQDREGRWSGELLATARALLTIFELREAWNLSERDPGIGRALGWIRARRGLPGAWTDGCSAERHRHGFCHHFMGGFFSPAPPEVQRIDGVLRSGATASNTLEARFLASVTALRALLSWEDTLGTDDRLHLQGLRHVIRHWPSEALPELSSTALIAAVHALLRSTRPEDREAAELGLHRVAGRQRGDGSWVGTDPFHAIEVFLAAEAAEVCTEACHQALWHGTRLLVSTQDGDGSWGGDAAERRVLIACRALRSVDPPG
jgi:hypothetical protein